MEPRRGIERTKRTRTLPQASVVSRSAFDAVFVACYEELRRRAHTCLSGERPEQALQATKLVHEAYLRLVHARGLDCTDHVRFLATATRVMRHILVDCARRRRSAARRAMRCSVLFDTAVRVSTMADAVDLRSVEAALAHLQFEMPDRARVIEIRRDDVRRDRGDVAPGIEDRAALQRVRADQVMRDPAGDGGLDLAGGSRSPGAHGTAETAGDALALPEWSRRAIPHPHGGRGRALRERVSSREREEHRQANVRFDPLGVLDGDHWVVVASARAWRRYP